MQNGLRGGHGGGRKRGTAAAPLPLREACRVTSPLKPQVPRLQSGAMRSPGVHTARTPPASRLSRICAQIVLFLPLRLRTAAKAAAPEETSSSPQPALCVSRMRTSPGAVGAARAGISGLSSAALASPPSASAGDADPAPRFPERRMSAWGISETEPGSAQRPLRGTGWGASG